MLRKRLTLCQRDGHDGAVRALAGGSGTAYAANTIATGDIIDNR